MEIRRLIDDFGDDIFALALLVTKDFDSAKQVFVKAVAELSKTDKEYEIYDIAAKSYELCKDCDTNDEAVTLTGISLSVKQEAVLETVLAKPQIIRTIIHMHYENDLEADEISRITGESEKYISSQLENLSAALKEALDKLYKNVCLRIHAGDKLKAYVIRSGDTAEKRAFEVKGDAVPTHKWTKRQKAVVIAVAVFVLLLAITIQLFENADESVFKSYENVPTDEVFTYTYEADEPELQ
jgi:nucleoid-associated protein YgaU